MKLRYGVDADGRVLQIGSREGPRVVAAKWTSLQSVAIGEWGRWLVTSNTVSSMGETETDLEVADRFTLEHKWGSRLDRDDRFGRHGDLVVVGRYFPSRFVWKAWRVDTWEQVEGFDLPEGKKLRPIGWRLTSIDRLPKLRDASPLGRWSFSEGTGRRRTAGVVIASEDGVVIETERKKGEVFVRRIDEEHQLEGNRAVWRGEHGGEDVRVTILALNDEEAELEWRDGVTHDWEMTLTRA